MNNAFIRRRGVAIAAVVFTAGLLFGVGQATHVAAAGQPPTISYPLVNVATGQYTAGNVTVLPASSATNQQGYTVNLRGATPSTSFTVQGCYSSPSLLLHSTCTNASPSTIKTDPSGNATATVYINRSTISGIIDTITVTNAAKSTESYRATVAGAISLPGANVGLPGYIPPLFAPVQQPGTPPNI